MNTRKLFFILIVSLTVVSSISAVSSALFLDFLDDATSEPDTPVTLDGINFTIPAGYKQDTVNNTTDEDGITTVEYIYGNDEGLMIVISFMYNAHADQIKKLDDEHTPKTMGDIDGQMSSGENFYNFVFVDSDRLISVVAHNESIVQKIVTGK